MTNELLNVILEDIQFVDIMTTDMSDNIVQEAFWEGHNLSEKARRVKKRCKEAKRLANEGKKSEAKKMYNDALKELNEIKSLANKMPKDSVWDWVARLCTIAIPLNPAAIPTALVMNLPHIVRYYRAYKAGEDSDHINKGNAIATIDEIIGWVKKEMDKLK